MKSIRFVAALIAILLILAGCKQTVEKPLNDEITTQNNENSDVDADTSEFETATAQNPADNVKRIDIQSYMQYFVNYFHEPYKKGDDISQNNVLYLSLLFCFSNREYFDFVKINEVSSDMEIDGSKLENVARCLVSDSVELSDYHYCFQSTADRYSEYSDKYTICYATDYWEGDRFYIDSETPMDITDNGDTVTVLAHVYYRPDLGLKENMRTLEYKFEKTENNGVWLYQINEINLVP